MPKKLSALFDNSADKLIHFIPIDAKNIDFLWRIRLEQ